MTSLKNDPQYQLFFYTHYRKVNIPSYQPHWTKDSMYFEYHTVIVKNELTIIQKLRYYMRDFRIWLKKRNVH